MPHPKSLWSLMRHNREFLQALRGLRNQRTLSIDEHLRLCGDWLLRARRCSQDGGYAASFSLLMGWSKGYVETTGYIIPTLLDMASVLNVAEYRSDALAAGEWLLTRQLPNGAFPDLDGKVPEVFDTGQDMLGLDRLYRETGDGRYLQAANRAADWLLTVQQSDGSWLTSEGTFKTYLTRTAAALIAAGLTASRPEYVAAGERFLTWAASQQLPNGFFEYCQLRPGRESLLHTMVYVLEGYVMAWQSLGKDEYLRIALRGAAPLQQRQLTQDLVPLSYYHSDWTPASQEKCIPGLAQWANLCFTLHAATKNLDYLRCGEVALFYVQSKQIQSPGALHGALPASVPFWGRYQPYAFVNWAVKFLADALLQYRAYQRPAWKLQEEFVGQSFRLRQDAGGWAKHAHTLDRLDELVMGEVAAQIQQACAPTADNPVRVLDLGCGEGRCLDWLSNRLPGVEAYGVDPCGPDSLASLRAGSAYEISFPDDSFDAVYSYVVLGHVSDLSRVLAEVRRVLRPGGLFIVGDRHRHSARGLLKPWHELRGRWMYAWDSPFRERWYTPAEWRRLLMNGGFTPLSHRTFCNPGDRGIRRWLATNRFVVIAARNQKPPSSTEIGASSIGLSNPPLSAEMTVPTAPV